jgi:hypothetical protein
VLGNNLGVYETVKLSAPVFANAANASFAPSDLAPMVAKAATHSVFIKHFIKH